MYLFLCLHVPSIYILVIISASIDLPATQSVFIQLPVPTHWPICVLEDLHPSTDPSTYVSIYLSISADIHVAIYTATSISTCASTTNYTYNYSCKQIHLSVKS